MNRTDAAAIGILVQVTETIASLNGPIDPEISGRILTQIGDIMRLRGRPMTMSELDHVIGLIEAVKQEITA